MNIPQYINEEVKQKITTFAPVKLEYTNKI